MSLRTSCPRCPAPLDAGSDCPDHGPVPVLWRCDEASYDDFAEVLGRSGEVPVLLPWPMSTGWSVADFGVVTTSEGHALASVTTVSGASSLDGEVALSLVLEEPAVGLGGRCARTGTGEPGSWVGEGQPAVRVQVERRTAPLWAAPADEGRPEEDDLLARSVFVGEYAGRWLWLVVSPASAALLLRDDWLLADASGFGPEAVEMPFGGPAGTW